MMSTYLYKWNKKELTKMIENQSNCPNSNKTRCLTFKLDAQEFAIPLLSIKEVIPFSKITPIPCSPSFFLGIIDLRGKTISIIDLKQKLGLNPKKTVNALIIICDLPSHSVGFVVDSVDKIISPKDSELSEKPQTLNDLDYFTHVFKKNEAMIPILDINKLICTVANISESIKNAA
jgi:purine-binding chemotaxis protein CheW